MSELAKKSSASDFDAALLRKVRDSGVVNFDQLGKLIAEVTPELFDPGVVADDYIATGVTSFVKIIKFNTGPQLEQQQALRALGQEIHGR